ncbi:MAG: AlpA family phage regulatory protein [Thiobacillus sp.]|nr:AlpA family phage regulatory protein [Thiobacillus sp.]
MNKLPETGYVSAATLAAYFESSVCTVWRWTKSGRLPQPVKLGESTTRWNAAEVHAAIAKLAA